MPSLNGTKHCMWPGKEENMMENVWGHRTKHVDIKMQDQSELSGIFVRLGW